MIACSVCGQSATGHVNIMASAASSVPSEMDPRCSEHMRVMSDTDRSGDTEGYSAWVERLEPIARERVEAMNAHLADITDGWRSAVALATARGLENASLREALRALLKSQHGAPIDRMVAMQMAGIEPWDFYAWSVKTHAAYDVLAAAPDSHGTALLVAADALLSWPHPPSFYHVAEHGSQDTETCAFCLEDNGHSDDCPWPPFVDAYRRARGQTASGETGGPDHDSSVPDHISTSRM